jgi:hypothetical protein
VANEPHTRATQRIIRSYPKRPLRGRHRPHAPRDAHDFVKFHTAPQNFSRLLYDLKTGESTITERETVTGNHLYTNEPTHGKSRPAPYSQPDRTDQE